MPLLGKCNECGCDVIVTIHSRVPPLCDVCLNRRLDEIDYEHGDEEYFDEMLEHKLDRMKEGRALRLEVDDEC